MKEMSKVKKENIILDLNADTKEEVIEMISRRLLNNGYITNEDKFISSVKYREAQTSTGIGNGIAIPHGASNSVIESTVVFAKLKKTVQWDSLDSLPVEYVFLLAIAKNEHGDSHIRVLANLAKDLMDSDYVEQFKKSDTLEEIYISLNKGEN